MKKNQKKVNKKKQIDYSQAKEYEYHLPVFLEKVLEYLNIKEDGIYIDGTLGGGGHSSEILRRLGKNGKLLAFDKDVMAIEYCLTLFAEEIEKSDNSRISILNQSFSEACSIKSICGKVNGILLDLGVSSRQLDDSNRGFSYRFDSPLNLRFSSQGIDGEELLNTAKQEEIESLLRKYGEEPFARNISRLIVERRRVFPIKTTLDLRKIIEESVPPAQLIKSLSRVFQAIRIAVNDELSVLEEAMRNSTELLTNGGRIVVISYHSLEDRIVKNILREYASDKYNDDPLPKLIRKKQLKILTNKPIIPDEIEIKNNPRSRSAKLRIAEKL